MKTSFILVFSLFIVVGCKQEVKATDKPYRDFSPEEKVAAIEEEEEARAADMKVMSVSMPSPSIKETPIANSTEQKIIRSATLKFQTDDLVQTNDRVIASVKKFGGYLQNDRESKEYKEISRNVLVRVPSKNFDAFLKEISTGVEYFDEKNISSEDVTSQYIDNDSRIKTQKALENRYLELLKKANKVSEMLEVEEKLSQIRVEIEAKQARLNYLQTQVEMSAFDITFYKKVPQKESASVSFGSKIGNALASGVNGLLDFFIGLLEMWPFILILVALIVFFRKRWKRRKNQ